MKAYKRDDKNHITGLNFLAQLKRVCDFNDVSEGIKLRVMSSSMKEDLASRLSVRMNRLGDGTEAYLFPQAGGEQIMIYVEALTYLLRSYMTDSNIAKAISAIAWLKKAFTGTLVQFAGVMWTKVARCRNAYPEKQTKKISLTCCLQTIRVQSECFGVESKTLIFRRLPNTLIRCWSKRCKCPSQSEWPCTGCKTIGSTKVILLRQ